MAENLRKRIAGVLVLAIMVLPLAAGAEEFKLPFTPRVPGNESKDSCPKPPKPVVSLKLTSKYGKDGARRDTVDPKSEEEFNAQMKPINDYAKGVIKQAQHYTETGDPAAAKCALTWLDAWAKGDGLTEMENETAHYKRGTTTSGLSFGLMQVMPAIKEDVRLPGVQKWLARLARSSADFYQGEPERNSARNNHSYWVGLAEVSAAVVSGDRALFDRGVASYKKGVCGATKQGALPLEVGRGKKARAYHLYALSALVPLAATAEANGVDAFGMCDGAIHRIVKFSLSAIDDPAPLAEMAEAEQDPFEDKAALPPGKQLTFMVLYHQKFPGRAPLEEKLMTQGHFVSTALGGDQELLYPK